MLKNGYAHHDLSFGGSQSHMNNYKSTIHDAACYGTVALMKFLIAKPYCMNPHAYANTFAHGVTTLHAAATGGNIEVMQFLINTYHFDPRKKDSDGKTALHYLAKCGNAIGFSDFLLRYPLLSAACWIKDSNGDTPNDSGSGMNPRPIQLLQQHFLRITQAIAQGQEVAANACLLLEAFTDQWKNYLLKNAEILNIQGLREHTTTFSSHKKIAKIFSSIQEMLELNAIDTANKPFTYSDFENLLNFAKKISEKERSFSSYFFSSRPEGLLHVLKTCLGNITNDKDDELSADIVRTIYVIINDYERVFAGRESKALDDIIIQKLLMAPSIASLRPKATITGERVIDESNYAIHLSYMEQKFSELPVSSEIKRITNEIIFPGLRHLMEHSEDIIMHITQNFGALYYLVPEKLPLHTDHVPDQNPVKVRNTLRRLLQNIIGAFYCCEAAAQLPEYFNKLNSGYCLEGRVRDTLEWAMTFSEIKSINEFMQNVIDDYSAYYKVMGQVSDENLGRIEPALNFIMQRYRNFPCKQDTTYAPESIIEQRYVRLYLADVLAYDAVASNVVSQIKKQTLPKL